MIPLCSENNHLKIVLNKILPKFRGKKLYHEEEVFSNENLKSIMADKIPDSKKMSGEIHESSKML